MRIVALDLSLTCSGVADENGTHTIRPRSTGMERLAEIRRRVIRTAWLGLEPVDLIVIEGYSFGAARPTKAKPGGVASHAHGLGELGGVVRLALWEASIPFVDVAPATLKRYATGRGNAGKPEVLTAAVKRLGYDGHDDNEADALWLYQMALARYEPDRAVPMPQTHLTALAGVAWPELAVTA